MYSPRNRHKIEHRCISNIACTYRRYLPTSRPASDVSFGEDGHHKLTPRGAEKTEVRQRPNAFRQTSERISASKSPCSPQRKGWSSGWKVGCFRGGGNRPLQMDGYHNPGQLTRSAKRSRTHFGKQVHFGKHLS